MDMEAQDDHFMGSNDLTQIVKGKRTKRQRSSSPYKVMTSSSSSGYGGAEGGGGGGGSGGGRGVLIEEYGSNISSPTTSSEVCESTEEEEDMANCLILLAQGDVRPKQIRENKGVKVEKFSIRKFSDMSTPSVNKAGFFVYECKTCNRSFPSFQALGGHRASHKKPKATVPEEKKGLVVASMEDVDDFQILNKRSPADHPSLSLQTPHNNSNVNRGLQPAANKAKIHECSICGSEFMSGQALGGHMRRHRANTSTNYQAGMVSTDSSSATTDHQPNNIHVGDPDQIKPRNILALDLNLPAPEDDHHLIPESKFQFTSAQQALVFSAPALVDCHY